MEMMFFTNPNPGAGLVETKRLNRYSEVLRASDVEIKEEGFNICPFDFVWEYEVRFEKGFIVFREMKECDTLRAWVYTHENDLDPTIYMCQHTDLDLDGIMFISHIRQMKSLLD